MAHGLLQVLSLDVVAIEKTLTEKFLLSCVLYSIVFSVVANVVH